MNLLHPASQPAKRAIDVAARAVLVVADLAIISFLFFYLAMGGSIVTYAAWVFAILTLSGVVLSIYQSRWGGLFLLLPIIIFSAYAVMFFLL